ncbi:hypothetical protein ACHAXA_001995 [Cyclostephanos tholiformis]|uniref:Bromodomain associated domain-containing protein n=1 Tax=Cyclostephanos tholiformis TaxID=382380 RepID=A0ABD3RZK2_9STRA
MSAESSPSSPSSYAAVGTIVAESTAPTATYSSGVVRGRHHHHRRHHRQLGGGGSHHSRHHPQLHSSSSDGRGSSDAGGRRTVMLSGGSPSDCDAAYCTEIARRAVARAALHLGIEGMEGEALDVLGSVLLGYMEMVGATISTNVELSGRSSAHANAYDALNAIVECTAPAAIQIGYNHHSSTTSSSSVAGDPVPHQPPGGDNGSLYEGKEWGWEGLASFLFGPDWFSIPLEGEDDRIHDAASGESSPHASEEGTGQCEKSLQTNAKSFPHASMKVPGGKNLIPKLQNSATSNSNNAAPKVGKGKQLSNMIGYQKSVSFTLDHQHTVRENGVDTSPSNHGGPSNEVSSIGWRAPYLNAIPPFPLVTNPEDVANPHRLSGTKIPQSMHNLATEMEACRETPLSTKLRKGSADSPDGKLARMRDEVSQKAMRIALRIPDDVYSTIGTVWGSIRNGDDMSNKKKTGIGGDVKPPPDLKTMPPVATASKVKFDAASSKQHSSDPSASTSVRMPPYVPKFLPPFPTDHFSDMANDKLAASMATSAVMSNVLSRMHKREKRKSSDIAPDGVKKDISDRDVVRRSVIRLGRSVGPTYWGSIQLNDDAEDDEKKVVTTEGSSISNSGKLDVFVAPGGGKSSSSVAKKSGLDASQQIMPLGRASGSRIMHDQLFSLTGIFSDDNE